MGKYARKFFVFTVFSAVGLFMMSLNPNSLHSLKAALSMIKLFRTNQLPTGAEVNKGDPQAQELMNQLLGIANKNKQMEDLMKTEGENQEIPEEKPVELAEEDKPKLTQVVIPAGQEYKREEESHQEFVQINGRYYPARADNTYMVNGEKIFHLNGRRYTREEVTGVSKIQAVSNTVVNKIENTFQSPTVAKPTAAPAPSVSQEPMPASVDTQKIMQDLQNTQKRMEEQKKFLEQLMKEK